MSEYPTEEQLKKVREWDVFKDGNKLEWLEYCLEEIYILDYGSIEHKEKIFRVATGGWSGNEDIIHAMCENTMAWSLTYHASARGGLYVFYGGTRYLDLVAVTAAMIGKKLK